jgi:Meiotically up-regulated gene 113
MARSRVGRYGLLVGYVYAFRHGRNDEFKFGRTTNLERRRKTLQTGCPKPLTVFDFIETDEGPAGEKFLLRRLASKQLIGEIFAVTANEASDAMQACQQFLENELPRLKEEKDRIAELSMVESGPEMLPASQDVLEKYKRLIELRADQKAKRIEIGAIEAEVERLEMAIKLAIGTAAGIDGVATWETGASRRSFNAEALKAANPEEYELYLTKFDQTRFKLEQPDEYASYQETARVHKFLLIDDF